MSPTAWRASPAWPERGRKGLARLWGAAEALRRTMSAPLPPADRPDYERSMAAARACLDEVSWEAAFAEGSMSRLKRQQSMPWEKATVPDRTTMADNGVGMVADSPESSTLSEVALLLQEAWATAKKQGKIATQD